MPQGQNSSSRTGSTDRYDTASLKVIFVLPPHSGEKVNDIRRR
jgi:hypothetical protein